MTTASATTDPTTLLLAKEGPFVYVDQSGTVLGPSYWSDEEKEFVLAVEKYRTTRKRKFPTSRELLAVALSLGYRKTAPPTDLPTLRAPFKRDHDSR